MKNLIICVGTLIITAILFALPILTGVSFALNWDGGSKFLFSIFTLFEFTLVSCKIYFDYA